MRIAMVGPFGFHPNKTMRSRAFQLARALVERGHTVRIVMPPWQTPGEANREWVEDGVSIRNVALSGGVPGITIRLVRNVLDWNPDVVHCFKPKAYSGLVAWWLWRFYREQFRLVMDSDDWEGAGGWNEIAPYSPLQKRFFAWQERWGMAHCHALTVASRALESLAWGQGIPIEQVHYLPNGPGVNPTLADAPRPENVTADGPILLLYSRLFEFNTGHLVDVLSRVKAAEPGFKLLMVGAGLYAEDAAGFRQQLDDAGLMDHVNELGWVEEGDVPRLLAAADVGIYLMEDTLLNRAKCPVKLADMVACGLPVVGEDVGQVGEYVRHEHNGLLRRSGDASGLAEDIVRLFRDAPLRQTMSAQARAHYQAHFTWEQLAKAVESVYSGGRT